MAKFVKGQSGNPGGRPKESNDLKELARKHTEEALDRLVFWMRSENASVSVSASQGILDRGYGKPVQATELSGKDGQPISLTITATDANVL